MRGHTLYFLKCPTRAANIFPGHFNFFTMFSLAAACLLPIVLACGGDHGHSRAKRMQPGATPSSSWPSAPLEWGDINFLHTTDSHGV
jgi:hypothetical protein